MTNERAIELLNRISDSQFDGPHGDERREALEMAVKALVDPNLGQKTIDCIIKRLNDEDRITGDTIYRQDAIDAVVSAMIDGADAELVEGVMELLPSAQTEITEDDVKEYCRKRCLIVVTSDFYDEMTRRWASAQPERDIPVKPIETTDKAWGIPKRQAVCPNCDYYLGHVAFLGDYKGKRVTYCETCGQAIDWEGWNFDE